MGAALKRPARSTRGAGTGGGATLLSGKAGHIRKVLAFGSAGVPILLQDLDRDHSSNGPVDGAFRLHLPLVRSGSRAVPDPGLRAAPPEPVAGAPATDDWGQIADDLRRWEDFGPDWDGEDGVAPTHDVIEAGLHVLRALELAGAPLPEHYVAGDGEIGFRWSGTDAFASVSLLRDGHILLYMHRGDKVLHRLDALFAVDLDLAAFIGDIPGAA